MDRFCLYFAAGSRASAEVDLDYKGIFLKDKDDIIQWIRDYRPSDKGLWLPPGLKVFRTDTGVS